MKSSLQIWISACHTLPPLRLPFGWIQPWNPRFDRMMSPNFQLVFFIFHMWSVRQKITRHSCHLNVLDVKLLPIMQGAVLLKASRHFGKTKYCKLGETKLRDVFHLSCGMRSLGTSTWLGRSDKQSQTTCLVLFTPITTHKITRVEGPCNQNTGDNLDVRHLEASPCLLISTVRYRRFILLIRLCGWRSNKVL